MIVTGLTTAAAVRVVMALPAKSIDLDDPNSVSPGILGFLAFFLLAVALYFLVRNMNGHLRRVRYRQEALDAEAAEAKAKADADAARTPSADRDAADGTTPTS